MQNNQMKVDWKISKLKGGLLRVQNFHQMSLACYLPTRFPKILNVSLDQKTRPNICFKTRNRAFQKLGRDFKKLG